MPHRKKCGKASLLGKRHAKRKRVVRKCGKRYYRSKSGLVRLKYGRKPPFLKKSARLKYGTK